MQDRFKFRFWHKPTQKIMDCYGFNEDFVFGDTLDGVGTEYNPAKFEDCILMQCTGLKDKNEKLIYEGYILKYTSKPTNTQKNNPEYKPYTENYSVVWEDFYTGYNLRSKEKVNCFNLGIMAKDCEVIGNIYENPELLEVGK